MSETFTPEQLSLDGKKAYSQKNYAEAARLFGAAAEGFRAAGKELDAAEMDNNRSVAHLLDGDYEGALQAADGTPSVFEAAGDTLRQAMAFGNLGAALDKLGRLSESIAAYEQAAFLFKKIGEHDLRAPVMEALATLQMRSGRTLEAMASLNTGLDEYQEPGKGQRLLKKLVKIPFQFFFKVKT